jgi:hypothetical protein
VIFSPADPGALSAVRAVRSAASSSFDSSNRRRASCSSRACRTISDKARWIVSVVPRVSSTSRASSTRSKSRLREVRLTTGKLYA